MVGKKDEKGSFVSVYPAEVIFFLNSVEHENNNKVGGTLFVVSIFPRCQELGVQNKRVLFFEFLKLVKHSIYL